MLRRLAPLGVALGLIVAFAPVSLQSSAPFVVKQSPTVYAGGGPVILDGTDAGYHGSVVNGSVTGQWIYIKKAYENLIAGVNSTYKAASNGHIAVVGAPSSGSTSDNVSNNCGAAAYWGATTQATPVTVDFYDGASAIETFFNDVQAGTIKPLLIHIVDTICNTNKMDATEYAKVNAAANAIATHVNRGGALFANTGSYAPPATNYGWLSAMFPTLTANTDMGSALQLTTEGQSAFPGLTNSNIAGAWHNGFVDSTGTLPLTVLAKEGSKIGIIGGASVTLPSAVTVTATPSSGNIGSQVCLTVNVKKGNPLANFAGATVTFAITGVHSSTTFASKTTDADGNTTSVCYTGTLAGSDSITATAVNPSDSSNLGEGVVTVTWAAAATTTTAAATTTTAAPTTTTTTTVAPTTTTIAPAPIKAAATKTTVAPATIAKSLPLSGSSNRLLAPAIWLMLGGALVLFASRRLRRS